MKNQNDIAQKSYPQIAQKSHLRGKPQVKADVIITRGKRAITGYVDPVTEAEATAAIQQYLEGLSLSDLQSTTTQKYHRCLSSYRDWLAGRQISQQTAREFLNHLRQQGFQTATVRCYYHALKPFLASLDIPLQLKFRKQHRLPTYHSPDQLRAILSAIENRQDHWHKLKERDRLIVLILAYTGIRRAELLSLRLRDINFHSKMLTVRGKGGKERAIPIADILYPPLCKYTRNMQTGDYLFPIQPRRLWSIIVKYATEAGIDDFHPHSFRHYFATQLVEKNTRLDDIQRLLGHADISTTAIYLDVIPKHLTNAVSHLPNLTHKKLPHKQKKEPTNDDFR